MIVAVYVNGITLWSPVSPVSRIERLSPMGRESSHSRQEENSFAAMFGAMTKTAKRDTSNGFDSQA